jgi:hypothetical protein
MLAYIFWHRPYPQTEQKSYEAAIVRFQRDLAAQPPPGFVAAASSGAGFFGIMLADYAARQ